ncbi:hypothetical protein Tco_0662380 [Tanacetum coccineum]
MPAVQADFFRKKSGNAAVQAVYKKKLQTFPQRHVAGENPAKGQNSRGCKESVNGQLGQVKLKRAFTKLNVPLLRKLNTLSILSEVLQGGLDDVGVRCNGNSGSTFGDHCCSNVGSSPHAPLSSNDSFNNQTHPVELSIMINERHTVILDVDNLCVTSLWIMRA